MKKYKKYMKLVLFTTIITLGLSCFNKLVLAYSPEEGKKIEAFIEKNNDLITSEEKEISSFDIYLVTLFK